MNISTDKIIQLLDDGLKKYDNPTIYQMYVRGVLDALTAVIESQKLEVDEPDMGVYYEPLSGRYFSMPTKDFDFIIKDVSEKASNGESMTVNEWFGVLGLEPLVLSEHYYWPIVDSKFAYVTPEASGKDNNYDIHYNKRPILKTK